MILMITTAWRLLDRRMQMQAVGITLLMLFTAVLEAAGIGLIFPLFQVIGGPGNITSNRWLAGLHGWVGAPRYSEFLVLLFVGLFLFYVMKNFVVLLGVYLQNRFVWRNNAVMANNLLGSYLHRPYTFHIQENSADLLRNMTHTVTQFFHGTVTPIMLLVAEACVVIFVTVILLAADPMAAVTVGVLLGVPLIVVLCASRRPMGAWGHQSHELKGAILKTLNHALNAVREIKVLGREPEFLREHHGKTLEFASVEEKQSLVLATPRILLEVLAVGGLLAVGFVVLDRGDPATDALPVLGVFGAAAFRLTPSFNRISSQINAIRFNAAALAQIAKDLDEPRLTGSAAPNEGIQTVSMDRSLAISGLSYSYKGAAVAAIDNVNFSVERGESVAFVGRSGSGKTTLAGILLGLLEPETGCVIVDDEDLSLRKSPWCLRAGFVPQDVFLLDSTLKHNIAFRLNDDDIDDARVERAAAMSQVDGFVSKLPAGFETVVGERGVKLSGGQRQRVAIARALYDDPDILVMDEATSALDAETESSIARTIAGLHGVKTLFIIAHRLSTVKNCDRIYWLANGKIADSGTFAELNRRNADFKTMVKHLDLSDAMAGE